MRALLDVNVLIALLDEKHTHHAAASDWLSARIESGWASCPQNAERMHSHPLPTPWASGKLARFRTAVSAPYHRFIADDVSLLDDAVADRRRLSDPDHAERYLASFAWRYNRRYRLQTMILRFIHSAAHTQPIPYPAFVPAESHG